MIRWSKIRLNMLFGLPATLGGPFFIVWTTGNIKGPLIAFLLINAIYFVLSILIELLIHFFKG